MLSPRIQYDDGKSVCYAQFQNGTKRKIALPKNFFHPNIF